MIVVACMLGSESANAFDIDGFYGGMTKGELDARLTTLGLAPQPLIPNPLLKSMRQVRIGQYSFSFCSDDALQSVSKSIDVSEFIYLLKQEVDNHGNPSVEAIPIKSQEAVLHLTWRLNDGSFFDLAIGSSNGKQVLGENAYSSMQSLYCPR
jgi:hypothetical protein